MLISLMTASMCLAVPAATDPPPPIVEIKDITPNEMLFGGQYNKPTVVRSLDEAERYLNKQSLADLNKQVDFKSQIVLIFAWRGSGQDKLSFDIAESFPEQILFTRTPGLTRDLRPHSRVYALRSNVKWSVK